MVALLLSFLLPLERVAYIHSLMEIYRLAELLPMPEITENTKSY